MQARTCTHEGCAGAPHARDLCVKHYHAWLVSVPQLRMQEDTRAAMLAALPASQGGLVELTGLAPQTVKRAIARMRKDGDMHIGDFDPPTKNGMKFTPIYEAGPGEDAVVTKKMRKDHHAKARREAHHRRKLVNGTRALPSNAGWAAALLIGA